jgi:hypothetical protein
VFRSTFLLAIVCTVSLAGAGCGTESRVSVAARSGLSSEELHVARRFIFTVVKRQNLREGWTLSGPGVRCGLTLHDWLTGRIAVERFTKRISGLSLRKSKVLPHRVVLVDGVLRGPQKQSEPWPFWLELQPGKDRDDWLVVFFMFIPPEGFSINPSDCYTSS